MPEKMTDDEVQSIVQRAVEDAVDFVESEISDARNKSQRYFDGECDVAYEDGRSGVISTKCRDVVRAVKPNLMRVFLQSDKPVEFVPKGPGDVQASEQATSYLNWLFWEQSGYRVLGDVFQDALVKKAGIVKAYWSDNETVNIEEVTGLSPEGFAMIAENAEVLEYEETPEGIRAKVSVVENEGKLEFDSVPPESFFVDRNARSMDSFTVVGDSQEVTVSDLVEMGFAYDEVKDLNTSDDNQDDEFERRGYSVDDDDDSTDPSMKKVLLTECYMKVDIEGTGVAKLYSFICGGDKYKILSKELADEVPYAVFEVDPEPHTFFGRSLVEIVEQDQDVSTSLLRGLIDNVHATNAPGGILNIDRVKPEFMEDWEYNGIGHIKRVTGSAGDAYMPFTVPFTAGSTIPAIQYYDQTIDEKTGVSRASVGMDPDALQSTTAAGVNATIQAASAQAEVMARNLAEGGMRQLFTLLLKLFVKHQDRETLMRMNGTFVPVDPRSWTATMDTAVNVGLGTNRHEERAMVLRETLQHQMGIFQGYGPQNGLVTLTDIRNTMADILSLGGVKNAERYWQPMTPEREQQLMQQAAQAAQQAQQGQGDPNAAFLQVETMKAQGKQQADMEKLQQDGQKAMAEEQRKRTELAMDDDRKRDEMAQDLALRASEILMKGGQVNVAAVKAEQAAPRG